jgi:hypothetical protein
VLATNLWVAEQRLERSSCRLIGTPITCVDYLRSSFMSSGEIDDARVIIRDDYSREARGDSIW